MADFSLSTISLKQSTNENLSTFTQMRKNTKKFRSFRKRWVSAIKFMGSSFTLCSYFME
jgi:hypothetical protein